MSKYFQFVRVKSYANKPHVKARKNGHKSARQVIDELKREPHASPHVASPRPPVVLRGTPTGTYEKAMTLHSLGRDARGHKLRKDTHILAGCIASYPVPVTEVEANLDEGQNLTKWVDLTMKWADDFFGKESIDTIVFHMDETAPHLHIIVLPPDIGVEACPLRRKQTEARRAYVGKVGQKTMANIAYRDAGTHLQDSYFKAVSLHFDHGRKRPPDEQKRRLNPREQRAKRTYEEGLKLREALLLQQAREKIAEEQRRSAVEMAERKERLDTEAAELALLRQQLALEKAQLDKDRELLNSDQSKANGSQRKLRAESEVKPPQDSSGTESERKANRGQRKVVDATQMPLELATLDVARATGSAPTPFRSASHTTTEQ